MLMSAGHLFEPLLPISDQFSLWCVSSDFLQPSGICARALFLLEALVSLLGYFLAASN